MSRWIRVLAGLSLCAANAWGTRANAAEPAVGPLLEEVRPLAPLDAPRTAFKYVGAGSCASIACHGGPRPAEAWPSSYRVWAGDPHASAYSVLYSDRSKRMVQWLSQLPALDDVKPYQEQRCLACHSIAEPNHEIDPAILADGVSCEVCHGPASAWRVEHTTARWNGLSAAQKQSQWGMLDIRAASTRAQLCVKCHVGAAGDGAAPTRDVNHDLIAAGHPRLAFEYHAYLENMPAHWDRGRDRRLPDYAAREWTIGQIASARAAIELLQVRAAEDEQPTTPWPEFAEYDCFACHHGLSAAGNRAEYQADPSKPSPFGWGSWYFSGFRLVEGPGAAEAHGALDELRGAMSHLTPDRDRVRKLAQACEAPLRQLASRAGGQDQPPFELRRLRRAATSVSAKNWDEAAQSYLALAALQVSDRAVPAAVVHAGLQRDLRYRSALAELRPLLWFSSAVTTDEGPASGQRRPDDASHATLDSPRDFDLARFNAALARLHKQLAEQDR